MEKNYFVKAQKVLVVLMILFASFQTKAQIATLDMSGNFTVHGTSSLWWQYRYKPTGSSTYTYSAIVQGSGTSIIKLNPFISWDFAINYYSFSGQPGPWSQDYTVNSDYVSISKSVGYAFDFNSTALTEGWRGYRLQNVTSNYSSNIESSTYQINGTSGMSMYMGWMNNYGTMLVSPKITDLATDKKFSIYANSYQGNWSVVLGTLSNPYDQTTFHPLKTVYLTGGGFNKIEVFLNNFVGSDQYIAIKSSGNYGEIYFDDFAYEQSVNCFDNSNLNVSNVTQSTAAVNFTADALQNSWELELKDITHSSTQTLSINTNVNYLLQNLTGNTTYQVKVRAYCALGLYSNWTPVQTFSTQCETVSSGYQTSFLENIYFDPCWNKIEAESTIYQAPIGGNTSIVPRTGSRYVMMVNNSTATTQKSFIVTPYLTDLSNSKRVKLFLISKGGSDYNTNSLTVGTMSNPNDATTFVPLKTISPLEMNEINGFEVNDYWKEHIIYLDNYDNSLNHHYIALKQNNIQYGSYFHIDDFTYETSPACKEPVNLKLVKSDSQSAVVTWENPMDPTNGECEVQYGLSGFALGTGTTVFATGSMVTLSSLSPFANYDFYVRSKCGTTEFSNWSDRGTFKTKCSGVVSGYAYDFENENFSQNSCWLRNTPRIRNNFYSANAFIRYTDSQSGTFPQPHSGSKMIAIFSSPNNLDPMVNEKSILVTPRLNDLNNIRKISFWANVPSSTNLVSLQIGTMSDPEDYTTFVPYETITSGFAIGQWKNYEVDFSNYYGTNKFVGIRMFNGNTNNNVVFIDDFIYGDNGCTRPSALAAQQSGTNSALLNWVTNNNDAMHCEIEYGELGFTPGTGTVLSTTSLPFTLNGLNTNTKYQFRVRNICGSGVLNWSLPYDFKISCSVTVPFEEKFDQYPATNGQLIPNFCWSTNENANENIYAGVQNYSFENFNSAPNSGYLYNSNANKSAFLISPFLNDFDATKRVKFWINKTNNSIPMQSVWIGIMKNPLDLTTFEPYQEIVLTDTPAYGKEVHVDFSNYQGSGKYLAFRLSGGSTSSRTVYFDDFKYLNQTSCLELINVQFLNISNNSVLIKWDNSNGANIQVEYGPENFVQGTGQVVSTTNNEILINGLSENTRYQFYIKTLCGQNQSLLFGPKTIATSCGALALPWYENFNQMPAYGQGMLPACMNLLVGQGLFSSNTSITPSTNYFNYDHVLSGNGDTSFLWLKNDKPIFTTPTFNLIAGVAYTFSLDARKAYQYDSQNIKVYVGRGRYLHYMEGIPAKTGQLIEYYYNTNYFVFTPIESGNYTFIVEGTSGALNSNIILDNFRLDQSYNVLISGPELYDFESGVVPYQLIAENTSNSNISVPTVNGNKKLLLKGGTNVLQDTDFLNNDSWKNNQPSISKVNFKIMGGAVYPLILKFDLKQTYNTSNNESLFRVIVNGNQMGTVIKAQSSNSDGFVTYTYDLSAYAGGDIYVSLQHLGKSGSGIGDNAFVDNIEITNLLGLTSFDWKELKVYPNPTRDLVTIQNNAILTNVEVLSINGQVLYATKLNTEQVKIDLSAFATGVYFVKVTSDEKQKIIKVVKK